MSEKKIIASISGGKDSLAALVTHVESGGLEAEGGRGMIALCREIDKESGRISVYPINAELTDETIFALKIRARVNPELRYFVTLRVRWESTVGKEIKRLLRRRELPPRAIEAFGGLVEL